MFGKDKNQKNKAVVGAVAVEVAKALPSKTFDIQGSKQVKKKISKALARF
jgi:flagellar basal body L-ring protein FlgH